MVDPKSGSDDDEQTEEEEKPMSQEERDARLLAAVKAGNLEETAEAIRIGADVNADENGWNALLWAACNGNEEIVRLLIKHNAHQKYKEQEEAATEGENGEEEEEKDSFKPLPDPAKTGRHTPMHWASYHGHHKVVWTLMKEKMNPLLQDMHGNTCIHQAAANSQTKVLKCFMQFGVDLKLKNARVHTPLDLATDPETRQLIIRGIKTTHCSGSKCNHSKFDFRNIQFYCETCNNFFCKMCSTKDWVYESKNSEVPDRPVCRCDNCLNEIRKAENNLREAMGSNDFVTLDKVLSAILEDKTDIDVRLKDDAEVLHLKLEKELDIRNFIASVAHVDNYKTIRKSNQVLTKKLEDSEKLGVNLDPELVRQVNECSERLISERNLRFEMENMYVSASTKETVDKLQELIQKASETHVENTYLQSANLLCGKMEDNITARETLQLLIEYPQREYPEPEPLDAKGKPIKQKDDKKKPKKRRKKEPPFPTPEWALQLDDVKKTVKKISDLAARAEELSLEPDFLAQVDEQIKRFSMEISFRKMKEEEERLEAEAKALAKKKKKK